MKAGRLGFQCNAPEAFWSPFRPFRLRNCVSSTRLRLIESDASSYAPSSPSRRRRSQQPRALLGAHRKSCVAATLPSVHVAEIIGKKELDHGDNPKSWLLKHHAAPVVRPGRKEVKPLWRWQGNIPTEPESFLAALQHGCGKSSKGERCFARLR